jgi:6-bladed beta-propeller
VDFPGVLAMMHSRVAKFAVLALAVIFVGAAKRANAQASYAPPNDAPNPYQAVANWAQLPEGRQWGQTSGVSIGPDGNIWALERCGGTNCAESDLAPIFEFDRAGKVLKNFGAGVFAQPHGLYVDHEGNVWVTDAMSKNGKGEQVVKFSSDGKVLLRLGQAGAAGKGPNIFNGPAYVVVGRNDDIFVADGHDPNYDSSRIVKFSKDGKFVKAWGTKGSGPGEFMGTHSIAIDSQGRLFVADRSNNRIEIFDQDGNFIADWKQFGRPSGLFIDKHDVLYSADSESSSKEGEEYNPGCMRGIRIGSVKDGKVTAFIPGPALEGVSVGPDGVTADDQGNVYGAEIVPKGLLKFAKN